jgi:competence protein ComEA
VRQPIEDSPSQPVVARSVVERSVPDKLRDWIEWFGLARMVTSAIAVVVICVGGWWLIRTPAAPPESALPVAAAGVAPGSVTLPPPSSVEAQTSDAVDAEPSVAVVHVAGAVLVPGVFEFAASGRVGDAIDRAGGPSTDADVGALNLAAPLVDGSRIYVPAVGEEVPISVAVPAGGPTTPGDAALPIGPVDVNRASTSELETLPGVGPATAAAIVTERDRNGPFVSFAELERVPGIGPAKLAALEGLVTT